MKDDSDISEREDGNKNKDVWDMSLIEKIIKGDGDIRIRKISKDEVQDNLLSTEKLKKVMRKRKEMSDKGNMKWL
jgi:hypothetical protein